MALEKMYTPEEALSFYKEVGYKYILQNDNCADVNYVCWGTPQKNKRGGYCDCAGLKRIENIKIDWSGFQENNKVYPRIEQIYTLFINKYECEYNPETDKIFVKKENFWFYRELLNKYVNIMEHAERNEHVNGKNIKISTVIKVGCHSFTFNEIKKFLEDIRYLGY